MSFFSGLCSPALREEFFLLGAVVGPVELLEFLRSLDSMLVMEAFWVWLGWRLQAAITFSDRA
jgi:hypothetical protein